MPVSCSQFIGSRRLVLLVLLGAVGASPAAALEPTSAPASEKQTAADKIRTQIDEIRKKHKVPGLVYHFLREGRVAAQGAVGVRKVNAEPAMTVNDKVHIGSCTKAMTAALIADLVREGKLKWSTRIGDVFADQQETIDKAYRDVTVDLLLRHRAGLPANTRWETLSGKTDTDKRRAIVDRVLTKPPPIPPDTKYQYSNVGYALAGLVAEEKTGQSWQTLMRQRIFQPLKMRSAGFGAPGTPGKIDQPWGHVMPFFRLVPQQFDNPSALGPAGIVHCSIEDWSKFTRLFTETGRKQPPILNQASIERLVTLRNDKENYARGWIVTKRSWAGGTAYTHSGSNTRWFSVVWISVSRDLVFHAVANAGPSRGQPATDESVVVLLKHFDLIE